MANEANVPAERPHRLRKIVVTGAAGLLGWHASARLHAANCMARYRNETEPFEIVQLDRAAFQDDAVLSKAVSGSESVLHFAGVNRGSDTEIEGNVAIARRLANICRAQGATPHVVYANSTHAQGTSVYGQAKRQAAEILAGIGGGFTDMILPHIFGECARPNYNNVTATFIDKVIREETPNVDPAGRVQLLYAGTAAQVTIDAAMQGLQGELVPAPRPTEVPSLFDTLRRFHADYAVNLLPDLSQPFIRDLFNSYRAALYPQSFPRPLRLHTDVRGTLFETVKGGGGGQSFASWTQPGITRGNHFHLHKIERFLVLEGEAIIRIRRVLGGPVWTYRVSGRKPAPVDMPTLHTHSIENVGNRPLLTLFWTHDLFDPAAPDTYFDPVLKESP
ncbi:NAD-dependent epimerase/dehydratase family protein [Paracoccus sp. YLB-12]|uniref:NAD-dependent epimerase/dehydratase family protein n=1 Tax=Paracoccus maritimus TaxID=2933292 RepID=A0ABT2KEZ9_9RHOB|nr:NAD-dependent epimerase/dehydratase family protein [Paracoccus sp. YLB-12]MCT4334430.1 NAD-dependent epimerase/dehydratase family protein [Paracoccus sp. YLB-12]